MVVRRKSLLRAMAMTAMGIDADTVRPAFNARYTVEAPKMMPKAEPTSTALRVNSFIWVSEATKGWNFFSDMAAMYWLKVEVSENKKDTAGPGLRCLFVMVVNARQSFMRVCSQRVSRNRISAAMPDMATKSMKKSYKLFI